MRINYNILWLDDDKTFLDNGREDYIKEYLQSKGFNPHIQHYYSVNDAEDNNENYDSYDLILSDFNLEPTKTGAFFINLIRNKNIITEILLYSAKNIDCNEIINKYGYLNRVTICDNIRDIDEIIIKLIDITIRKTQDICSLRGLIMSETTEIDDYIDEIIQEIVKIKNFEKIVLKNQIKITSDIRRTLSSKARKIDGKKYDKVYKDNMLFSAKPKYKLLLSTVKDIYKDLDDDEELKELINKIEGYEEIITIRNKFGHCKQEKREDGTEYLKIKDEKKEYDEEECTNLRREIRDYNLAFEKLHSYVMNIKNSLMELEDVKSS